MEAMDGTGLNNDTRGWIMCLVAGIACVFGASIIFVDKLVRLFPGKRDFSIQENSTFLACSLSLSFGVMIFMSLYSMLPEAKSYLKKGGISEQASGFILMGCFIGGFVGIQVLSRLFHQLLPSHVVDCDHSHDDPAHEGHAHAHDTTRRQSRARARSSDKRREAPDGYLNGPRVLSIGANGHATESSPLLPAENRANGQPAGLARPETGTSDTMAQPSFFNRTIRSKTATLERRPSMLQVQKRVMSFVKDTKANCDESGPCYGYSDPCGLECFKHLSSRTVSRASTLLRTATGSFYPGAHDMARLDEQRGNDEGHSVALTSPSCRTSRTHSRDSHHHHADHCEALEDCPVREECASMHSEDLEAQHHHHVAENAFLSIGLQTSVAIALHKFPEGFITYATNHANPGLGFNVFLALFVHNISEGFALALPLYMALGSRVKAMLWSSVLGGLSQPLGAGIAVLWFQLAKRTHMTPTSVFYGCLFAATAGIMASVALQLFVESLSLNHNRNMSIFFAFLGMSLLGLSNAFTSDAH
ncbi:vacuolar Zn-iron permease [Apiospora saccharicola]|uniref:Vacuolar Zn-iron permease n=1 Tax=Apiospora saccharicola TaxID=335842 RepID=A0ABR1WIU8_9PEZI